MKLLNRTTTAFALLLPSLVCAGGEPEDVKAGSSAEQPVDVRMVAPMDNTGPMAAMPVESTRSMQLYASDKAAELLYERSESVLNLNNSRASASFLFSEKRDNALTGSLMYDAEPAFLSGLTLSFGTKLFAGLLGVENADAVGLGASIEAAYLFPIKQLGLKLSGAISYAPDILTFGQSDRIIDWNIRSTLVLTRNIEGFAGVRFLQFDTRPGDRELDKRAHLGIRWKLGS